ncbi:TPM domain-containing protein [Lentiprolixibacter aurantiacus]|uniref:TPM domain-containing protein n=1 Tax=Lentiprolixibacter aurantiacus TaxID=2993939 RepID=A0AAE3MIE7_9FLAO|nr:TPM domain-containing protein [Lentiprolixibacter aurantiacus]MCX2718003.1 TPM domain-containing protein [Lentiprolixibacter aurantiacus]
MDNSKVEAFLTQEEEQEIVDAILEAERDTSGEIRVHLEATAKKDHFERAMEVFHLLKMDNTRERNGVLLYVAVQDHRFVIYGDSGINKVVPHDFWNKTKDLIQEHFKKGHFKQGIIEGVLMAGKELKTHFPWHPDDENELSNEVSRG